MNVDLVVRPAHSIVFLGDPDLISNSPADVTESVITANENCAAIWTFPEIDGETSISISNTDEITNPTRQFSLLTPSRKIQLSEASGAIFFECRTINDVARFMVAVSDESEPERITMYCPDLLIDNVDW